MRTINKISSQLEAISKCSSSRILIVSASRESAIASRVTMKSQLDEMKVPLIINETDSSFTFNLNGPRHVKFSHVEDVKEKFPKYDYIFQDEPKGLTL